MIECDVICVGAGLVGRLLSVGLAQNGVRVISLDKTQYDPSTIHTTDRRTTSISWGSRLIFEKFDLWKFIEPHAQPIQNIRVFEGLSPWVLDYDSDDLGNHPMGYIVENRYILDALHHIESTKKAAPYLTTIAPCTIKSVQRTNQCVTATLADDSTIKAPLIIAADGKHSPLRDSTNISLSQKDYGQNALVVHIDHEKSHENTAYEIFLPEGPLAVLPLKNQTCPLTGNIIFRSGIVWCKKNTYNFLDRSNEELAKMLFDLFPYYGNISISSQRWVYPMSILKVSSLIDTRIALAGDAGHVMHPIAGQGVNLGWRDADYLITTLSLAKKQGQDLGSPHLLNQYDHARKSDRLGLLYATDWINRLYQNQFFPLRVARNATFAILNRITPLKRTIMKRAMGLL